MPNHLHVILWICNEAPPTPEQEARLRQFGKPQPGSLGTIIGSFKSAVTKAIGEKRACKTRVWQPKFFDHIIRDDRDLEMQRRCGKPLCSVEGKVSKVNFAFARRFG